MDRKEMETALGNFEDKFRNKVRNDLSPFLKEQPGILRSDVRQDIQEQIVPVIIKLDELDN